jgi:hypothetical protein
VLLSDTSFSGNRRKPLEGIEATFGKSVEFLLLLGNKWDLEMVIKKSF